MPTGIEWCDETWNPIVGCSHISEGCEHCYAERLAGRLAAMGNKAYESVVDSPQVMEYGPKSTWNGKIAIQPSQLDKPSRLKAPKKIFVCSMGDIFHPEVTDGMRTEAMMVISENMRHTYMFLTKRPPDEPEHWEDVKHAGGLYKNIWMGVTAENQARYNERVPLLMRIPASVLFVSIEPMLGPVDLGGVLAGGLDWVICGPENGHGKRKCDPAWIQDVADQCEAAGVPFFDKRDGCLRREFPEAKS